MSEVLAKARSITLFMWVSTGEYLVKDPGVLSSVKSHSAAVS